MLNKIYRVDREVYNDWNLLFKLINQSMTSPTEEMMGEAKILKKISQNLIYSKNV